jgi:hypothetical protein
MAAVNAALWVSEGHHWWSIAAAAFCAGFSLAWLVKL